MYEKIFLEEEKRQKSIHRGEGTQKVKSHVGNHKKLVEKKIEMKSRNNS